MCPQVRSKEFTKGETMGRAQSAAHGLSVKRLLMSLPPIHETNNETSEETKSLSIDGDQGPTE